MRIEGSGSRLSPSREYFVFAYYVTGHGFGHATRVVEVVQHLVAAGHDVHVVTGAPDFVFTSNIQSPKLHIRKVLLDCGAVQADALTVDRLASLEMYHQTIVVPRDSILTTEVEWLKSINADLVVSDVVPIACRAAANAGIRSVCVTNFSLPPLTVILVASMLPVLQFSLSYTTSLIFTGLKPLSCQPDCANARSSCQEEIYVARAPGRLDVMGGIADYSGSLVLQMPIKEACHVAVQKNHPSKQKLWKHAQARQQAKGLGSIAVLQIVSFGSELSNRAPTFDIDLSDLMDGEQPMSYEKARQLFSQDPSQKWAAYAAGTVLVLMAELGVRFTQSISILVSSAVPEGKGVSSSAAVEVATMCAIAAAHDLRIEPRDIALLCQKVENHVVGAPCGVMDQMTSACGEANKLLAMVCQPAEVKELVPIPSHIRFWGLDSGIRHSVGGTDYGSVRIGAFMGRRMIKSEASSLLSDSLGGIEPQQVGKMTPDDSDEGHGIEILKTEALLDYLCNISTHRYECLYTKKLPERISGEEFLTKYLDHNDVVTIIDPKRTYAIKAPTKHPIYENFRVEAFKALLTAAQTDEQLCSLGELMYQCHYSYNECGLGSDGTDRLVNLVQEMQHSKSYQDGSASLFGAKITGGGSGGSVCVIGRNCIQSTEEIQKIQQRYKSATGYLPYVFEGSSPGAGKFGYLRIRMRQSLPDASPRN
ncbi:L-arabinokinase-like [Zingiber officinale]|uniref:L-arabinokinase-like n=1 Tax=Zingiber officinale TaxID=94328 RepID=UPI001C4D6DB6|nr:L-arabinokinase-like [Zingiber officinale]